MQSIRVVVLFSGSASSWGYLRDNDPNYGKTYEVVGAVTDRPDASAIQEFCQHAIHVRCENFRAFRKMYKLRRNDPRRQRYFVNVRTTCSAFQPDLLMCSGFMLIITEPLLSTYPILNVHPADLSILNPDGKPMYAGLHVVERQLTDGIEPSSTVHFITKDVDCGPIVSRSDPYVPKPGMTPEQVQEAMKSSCDGPAYAKALQLLVQYREHHGRLPSPRTFTLGPAQHIWG